MVVAIGEVSEADAHVVVYRAGDGDSQCDAEDCVRHCYGIDVAIAKEDEAGG
jgi:hypothetical protein